jgi:hypothetical protein
MTAVIPTPCVPSSQWDVQHKNTVKDTMKRVHYASIISPGTPSPLCTPTSRNQGLKAREKAGLACRTYNQCNYFYWTDPSMP